MCEACTEIDTRFEAVAKAAAPLGSRLPRVRDPVLGRWIAKQMHALLRNITAGHCALDVVIGEGLDALNVGRRAMDLSYSNIGDYAREELGINASTATKMARLARRLRDRPLVREAVRQGELTARKMTCVALRRAMQDKDEAQMCARGTFSAWMTVSVAEVVKAAFRAARAAAKRWLSAGECLVALAEHFIETWRAQLKQANTLQRRVRARDKHFCQVPGCSRAAVHAHHIKPRSQGGSDDPENLISLCAAHHLFGIHGGRMRVTGTAPDKLVWEFGLRRSYVAA